MGRLHKWLWVSEQELTFQVSDSQLEKGSRSGEREPFIFFALLQTPRRSVAFSWPSPALLFSLLSFASDWRFFPIFTCSFRIVRKRDKEIENGQIFLMFRQLRCLANTGRPKCSTKTKRPPVCSAFSNRNSLRTVNNE